ncbi:MAG: hypothetical protein ACFFFG_01045 [Candidatus Thorarchaeota archaeon]
MVTTDSVIIFIEFLRRLTHSSFGGAIKLKKAETSLRTGSYPEVGPRTQYYKSLINGAIPN